MIDSAVRLIWGISVYLPFQFKGFAVIRESRLGSPNFRFQAVAFFLGAPVLHHFVIQFMDSAL
jgi:hypothetical protein